MDTIAGRRIDDGDALVDLGRVDAHLARLAGYPPSPTREAALTWLSAARMTRASRLLGMAEALELTGPDRRLRRQA